MSNLEKYRKAFEENFGISEAEKIDQLEYNSIPEWDSVGHMGLMASLEDEFEIMMDMDDIVDFSSYQKGLEILGKYEVELAA
jgi:acyl carrier protein